MERTELFRKHAREPYEKAEECLKTNYHGTKNVTEELLPLLQLSGHGRIVNVTAHFGLLRVTTTTVFENTKINIHALQKK
jgi:(+)-neomenthol dehydrogenase